MKQNLHTHSHYDDGKDSIENMVIKAIEKNFDILGFSGHGYNHPLDEYSMTRQKHEQYKNDVLQAKEKYKDKIQIFYGIEEDSMHPLDEPYDYKIGSVHFLSPDGKPVPLDYSKERFEELLEQYPNPIEMAKAYYADVEEMISKTDADIIGHIDLITKYNEDQEYFRFDDPDYLHAAFKAVQAGIDKGKIFEMNTGAIARGYRKTPYPHPLLLDYMAGHGAKLCINTDCHNRDFLDIGISDCIKMAEQAGFKTLMKLTDQGFVPVDIYEWNG